MPPTRRHNSRKKPLTEIPVNALKPAKPAKPSHPTIETSPTLPVPPVPPVPPRATDILRADRNIQQYILQLEEHSEKLEEHITVKKRKFDIENSDEFEIEDISETGEEDDDEEDVPIAKRKNAKRKKGGEVVPETAEETAEIDRLFKMLRPDCMKGNLRCLIKYVTSDWFFMYQQLACTALYGQAGDILGQVNEFKQTGEAMSVREDGGCLVIQTPDAKHRSKPFAVDCFDCKGCGSEQHRWWFNRAVVAASVFEFWGGRNTDEWYKGLLADEASYLYHNPACVDIFHVVISCGQGEGGDQHVLERLYQSWSLLRGTKGGVLTWHEGGFG